jgi:hypothetical protein
MKISKHVANQYQETQQSFFPRRVDINVPDELGYNVSVPNDESLLWFKIALIKYHVKQL